MNELIPGDPLRRGCSLSYVITLRTSQHYEDVVYNLEGGGHGCMRATRSRQNEVRETHRSVLYIKYRETERYHVMNSLMICKTQLPEVKGVFGRPARRTDNVKTFLKRYDMMWSGSIWLRKSTSGGFLCWATGWTIGALGFDSRRGLGIFLFTTASRTALGPTQPPIQWVLGALSLGGGKAARA
jgi:hypothetical protein